MATWLTIKEIQSYCVCCDRQVNSEYTICCHRQVISDYYRVYCHRQRISGYSVYSCSLIVFDCLWYFEWLYYEYCAYCCSTCQLLVSTGSIHVDKCSPLIMVFWIVVYEYCDYCWSTCQLLYCCCFSKYKYITMVHLVYIILTELGKICYFKYSDSCK